MTVSKNKIKTNQVRQNTAYSSYKNPNIVIVGNIELLKKTFDIEKKFNVVLIFTNQEKLEKSINKETIAVIIDEKMVSTNIKSYILKYLKKYSLLPILFVSRSRKEDSFYKTLYEKGLQGVINWPKDAKIIPNLIIEFLKPRPKAEGVTKADEKLAKVIKSHLVLVGKFKSVKVHVIQGLAFIRGAVNSLYEKKLLENESSKVLGVKRSFVKSVEIKNNLKLSDKELERKIKMYMGNVLGPEKRSITVRVKNKVVTLMGTVTDHHDILKIEKFIMKQTGVQEIVRKVKYRPNTVDKHVDLAKKFEKKIKALFDGVKFISIQLFGDSAEVSGTVLIEEDRKLVEKYLMQTLPIKKVINKLYVA
jgi:osmotically-inducible protein OsmY